MEVPWSSKAPANLDSSQQHRCELLSSQGSDCGASSDHPSVPAVARNTSEPRQRLQEQVEAPNQTQRTRIPVFADIMDLTVSPERLSLLPPATPPLRL